MSTPLDHFLADIRPYTIGAPDPTVRREMLHALQEFCQRTWIWQYLVEDFTLDVGETEYEFDVPTGTRALGIVSCETENGGDFARYRYSPPLFRVLDTPTTATPLVVWVALKPADDAQNVDDAIYHDYRQTIAYGAIWRILAVPGKPWSNQDMAKTYFDMFQSGIRDAVRRRNANNTGRSLQVSFRLYR